MIISENLALSLSAHETKNNPHPKWCPNVKCINNKKCQPCLHRYLFILAQSRSGSTTIRNMINVLPNMRIGGETGQLINDMTNLFNEAATNPSFKAGGRDFKKAWGHYSYDGPSYLVCPAQSILHALNPPPPNGDDDEGQTILGIKEIKVNSEDKIKFLMKYFPCSRFIFNIRTEKEGEDGGSDSVKKNFEEDKWLELRKTFPALFKKFHDKLGPTRSYYMDMAEWSKEDVGISQFNDLAKWLGYEKCVYTDIFHDHERGYKINSANNINLGEECHHSHSYDFNSNRPLLQKQNDQIVRQIIENPTMLPSSNNTENDDIFSVSFSMKSILLATSFLFSLLLCYARIMNDCRSFWNKNLNVKKLGTE